MSTTIERLKHIIANDLDIKIDKDSIRDDISLLEGGIGLDSIAVMEFISLLEQSFGFQFSDDELSMEPFENLTTLTEFVENKIASMPTV